MLPISFKLNNNREVKIEGFHFHNTYGGLLEGNPNPYINKEIIKSASIPIKEWQHHQILFFEPTEKEINSSLGSICYSVWLSSSPIGDDNFDDGSSLVIIWFGDYPNDKSIIEILLTRVKDLDWEACARNYSD